MIILLNQIARLNVHVQYIVLKTETVGIKSF